MTLDPTVKAITEAPAAGDEESVDTEAVSRGRLILRRFLRRRLAMVGLAMLVALFLLAFFGPYLGQWAYDEKDFEAFLSPPSGDHWFGTNQVGADLYAQTLRGMQKSLIIGLLAAVFATGLAAVVGATAGYFGGWFDRALMWGVDLLLVLPAFLIQALVSPIFRDRSWLLFVVLLAMFQWMVTARIVRGMTLSLKEREYVQAARFTGVSSYKIIFRHILPNMSSLLIIDGTLNVALAIIGEAGLSFFGFGIQTPEVSLGTLIAEGSVAFLTDSWLFLFPAGMLVAIVLSVNLIGDGLRDALDPYSKAGRG